MTERNYNVMGSERKALVNKIAEITGQNPVYLGMPSVAFKVGAFEISRTGRLTWEDGTDEAAVNELVKKLKNAGFTAAEDVEDGAPEEAAEAQDQEMATTAEEADTVEPEENGEPVTIAEKAAIVESVEPEEAQESETATVDATEDTEGSDALSISLPDDLTDEQFALLTRLVTGKETLIRHAFKSDTVKIERAAGKLTFPWFTAIDGDHTTAYMLFLTYLVKFAKKASRVTAHDKPVENEKFAFRIFLIRLGMVGTEFKGARKILMENLSGNSAWRDGKPHTASKNTETAEDSSVDETQGQDDETAEAAEEDTQEAEA